MGSGMNGSSENVLNLYGTGGIFMYCTSHTGQLLQLRDVTMDYEWLEYSQASFIQA